MITLTIGNSYSRISGLTNEQMLGLKKILSYRVDFATARFIPDPAKRIKYCIDAKGNFATGLIHKVVNYLQDSNIDVEISNNCGYEKPWSSIKREFKDELAVIPYHDQQQALVALLGCHRGTCSMPTGTGKSHVIAMLVKSLNLKTLIVVPTLELKYQLTASLSSNLISMEGIVVENIDSNALNKDMDVDLLIIDECHRAGAKTYRNLNKRYWTHIRRRYCFSATPFRNDKEEQLLYEGICGEVVYELTYSDSVKNGYICPVEAYYYELPKVNTDSYTYAQVYKELIVENKLRNKLIANLLENLYNNQKHALCLVKEVAHGLLLSGMTGIPFSSGADDESRAWINVFKSGKLRSLIATEGLLGEGIDTKPCEFVIIAGLGRAKSAFMQRVGRCIRKYKDKETGKVIFFKDSSHKFLLTSFREHSKILREEYNVVPIKLEDL